MLSALSKALSATCGSVLSIIEAMFFILIRLYDDYVYSPLQTQLSPVVARIPRHVTINSVTYTVFSANIVSYTRTFLAVPVVWLVKYNYCWTAFSLVLLHDFLDHVDGIVAKVHKRIYGPVDDPLLGGFMDAFCDKIVNVTCIWSLLILTDYHEFNLQQKVIYVGACAVIIAYEFILGVVRVQDYFCGFYKRLYCTQPKTEDPAQVSSTAVMEGKLKEKLESMGIAFLCLSQAASTAIESISGIVGVTCLLLSIRLAHASLQHKLKARRDQATSYKPVKDDKMANDSTKQPTHITVYNKQTQCPEHRLEKGKGDHCVQKTGNKTSKRTTGALQLDDSSKENRIEPTTRRQHKKSSKQDTRVDQVYTVGCFDLFHHGHVKLFQKMKSMGKKLIVGVHDDHSIQLLKNRIPIDNTEKRMSNVKKYADVVYCVAGTNPWAFLKCIFDQSKEKTYLYVRGDDMQNFPARSNCEKLMPVKFLPYTQGVSSTKLRELIVKAKRQAHRKQIEDDDYSLFY